MVGKYEIVAQPIPGAAHMLRYTVFVGKQRIGAMVSRPTESDCRFLEKPPVVPPLKIFQVTHRPGRPKKGATPPQPIDRGQSMGMTREEIPAGITIGDRKHEEA
jgi:hypothetical protein